MKRALVLAVAVLLALPFAGDAHGRWATVGASYEGLNGYRDACGTIVNEHTMAVASHYPCGTVIWIHYGRHTVRAVTLDHGPYAYGRSLDLWWRTARHLGFHSGAAFGVRTVRMAVGR